MLRLILILLILIVSADHQVHASPVLEKFSNNSHAGIISEYRSVTPGSTFWMALMIRPEKEWHSYWKNPGDSGAAPILKLKSPDQRIKFSDLHWPVPERIPAGPLMTFGFEEETGIYWKVSVPKDFSKKSFQIDVDAEWLICKVDCIPAFNLFSTTVQISEELIPSEQSELLVKNIKSLPSNATEAVKTSEDRFFYYVDSKNKFIDFFPLKSNLDFAPPEKKHDQLLIRKSLNGQDQSEKTGLLVYREAKHNALTGMYVSLKESPLSTIKNTPSLTHLLWIIVSAFLGGLLLNIMPCVFPILALKIFGLGKLGGSERKKQIVNSVSYQTGVSVFFLALALLLWALRQTGSMVGWGFQLQSPGFVFILSCLFIILGTSYLGLIPEFSATVPQKLNKISTKDSPVGEFFTGMLAVLVATPCTAPLMGAALGFAVGQSFVVMTVIFLFMSIGFGFPFLLLSFFPALARLLPAPGPWMVTFKEFLSFPLFGTAIWLMWIYGSLTHHTSAVFLTSLWLLWFTLVWMTKKYKGEKKTLKFAAAALLLILTVAISPWFQEQSKKSIAWKKYSKDLLEKNLSQKKSVFVNITADWCITCQVNDKLVFKNPALSAWLEEREIMMIKGDWTRYDPHITEYLQKYNRASLPFYAWYKQGTLKPVILPEILTTTLVIDTLSENNLRGEL